MATYSTNLALTLITTGDEAGTWGTTTNTNLGTLLEQAISGYVTQAVSTGGTTTLTIPNGTTGVTRNMFIELTGTAGASTVLVVPANKKLYFIYNNATSGAVTVKVSGQTGVSVPYGAKMALVCNGTDIVESINSFTSLTNNSLTSGRVPYSTTAGLQTDSANLLYSGADLTVYGLSVGRGGGAIATNTAVGYQALVGNTTGNKNVALGYQAGYTNTTGVANVFLGRTAGYPNTTGSNNTAVGDSALSSNTTAAENTAVGAEAMLFSATAAGNTAIGRRAGYALVSGNGSNVFIGGYAGYACTGSFNTLVGYAAGIALTTGVGNTIIGPQGSSYNPGGAMTTGSKNTLIGNFSGNNNGLDIRTSSNNIVLSDGDGVPRIQVSSTGAVSIGNASTVGTLTVNTYSTTNAVAINVTGATTASTQFAITNTGGRAFFGLESSAGGALLTGAPVYSACLLTEAARSLCFGTNNTERMRIDSSGNVFIGPSGNAPTQVLDVYGCVQLRGTTNRAMYIDYSGNTNIAIQFNYGSATGSGNTLYFLYNGTVVGSVVTAAASVAYNTTSDYRLKNVIGSVSGSGARIDALKPIEYEWKSNNSQARGFLAHEFQEVYPNSVTGAKDGTKEEEYEVTPAVEATQDADGVELTPAEPAVKGTRTVLDYQAMQASTSEVIADLVAELQSLRKRIATLESK